MSNIIVTAIDEITIVGPIRHKGSNAIDWNVSLNGVPFGKIWTFKARGEVHPYHVKPLNGDHSTHSTYEAAERTMRAAM